MIYIITHKKINRKSLINYRILDVGGKKNYGYSDDIGENISIKNKNYCELTGIYWLWKNFDRIDQSEYIGIVHYRRYFVENKKELSEEKILEYLKKYDLILPKKRNYYIETIKSHYSNAHNKRDLKELKKVMEEKTPSYLDSFEKIFSGKKIHLYNMFIMKKSDFKNYCEWLFFILFELEKRIDIKDYDIYQQRVFGFLAERLLNVWVHKNGKLKKEIKVKNIEGENYIRKAIMLLKRKYKKRSYAKDI